MKKYSVLILSVLFAAGLPLLAVKRSPHIGTPQRFDSEPNGAPAHVPPVATTGTKAVGTADSILYQTGAVDVIWRTIGSPGGRNIGVDASGNLIVICSKASGNGTNPFIPQYCYSTDGGATWNISNLYAPGKDTVRRCYSAVAVDGGGKPHILGQAAYRLGTDYTGFEMRYLRDEAGIGGGVMTTPVVLNDSTQATGTTPYNPSCVIQGQNLYAVASDYSGVYASLSRDCHIGAISRDLGQTWEPTPSGFPMDTSNIFFDPTWVSSNAIYGGSTDGPILAVSDDGQHLVNICMTGGCVNPVNGDTLTELPFFCYSDDGGETWTYGGALNTQDTTIPRSWVDSNYVASGWWHIGSAVMDHSGILHVLWSSNGSIKTVDNNGVPILMYADPLVHSYNTAPYDYSNFIHEQVGNQATYDTVLGRWKGSVAFSCISCDDSNNIFFVFCDTYDQSGYTGLWAQVKFNSYLGLSHPTLNYTIDGKNVGSWCEIPNYIRNVSPRYINNGAHVYDTRCDILWVVTKSVNAICGRGGDTWSNVDCLMYLDSLIVCGGQGGVESGLNTISTFSFALKACRPNPVRDVAELSFSLPKAGPYRLRVYNAAGQLVRTLDGSGLAGPNRVNWNARDDGGRAVASGIYLYRLDACGNRATRKAVVLR